MNAFGDRARHTIVSGGVDAPGVRNLIDDRVKYEIAQDPPPLAGKVSVARFEAVARYTRRFDLVLTYDWGAIDGVMARRVFAKGAPPLVHHEDGFGEDEANGPKRERTYYRRVAFGAAYALVVPSRTLETIALTTWKQPTERTHRIANGVATALYADTPDQVAIPGFVRRDGEIVIGTVAAFEPVKDLPALVRAAGGLSGRFRLVIVGDGPERQAILDAADAMGIEDRVVLPGFLDRPHRYMRQFDVFAMASRSEQCPTSLVEAMAAGLPVVALPVGDIARMVATPNAPFIVRNGGEVQLRDAIEALIADPSLRRKIGAANRAKAQAEYDERDMISRYTAVYSQAMGRPGILG